MPSLTKNFMESLKGNYKDYPIFLETGLFEGHTILAMEPLFPTLFTVEIKEKYYHDVKTRYSGEKINFILGDSSYVFETLLPTLDEPVIFFLDGHWSSGSTGRSEKDCPLYEEMTHIKNLFKQNAIIIVDDYRLFGLGPNVSKEICNWEDIEKTRLLDIIKDRVTDVYHLPSELHPEDRLIIHIKSM